MSQPKPYSDVAIVSLVLGIMSLFLLGLFGFFAIPFSIAAIIVSIMALKKCKQDPSLQGRGFAIAGLVTGIVSAALSLIFLIIIVLFFIFAAAA